MKDTTIVIFIGTQALPDIVVTNGDTGRLHAVGIAPEVPVGLCFGVPLVDRQLVASGNRRHVIVLAGRHGDDRVARGVMHFVGQCVAREQKCQQQAGEKRAFFGVHRSRPCQTNGAPADAP